MGLVYMKLRMILNMKFGSIADGPPLPQIRKVLRWLFWLRLVPGRRGWCAAADFPAAVFRTLGKGPWKTFRAVALPMARPAIIVGVTLPLMETLNDLLTKAIRQSRPGQLAAQASG